MPTGYTAGIAGNMSFNEFIMDCARAMGACITMRDDPRSTEIPDKFEPSTYYIKAFKKATQRFTTLQKMSAKEAEKEAKKEFKKAVENNQKNISDNNELRKKYQTMLASVKEWQPPTPDHKGLKSFMVEQISESIEHDCSNSYYLDNPPKMLSGEEWLSKKISAALRNINYYETENQKEVERANGRTLWVQQLKKSLNKE